MSQLNNCYFLYDEKIKAFECGDLFLLRIGSFLECAKNEGDEGYYKFIPAGTILEILGTVPQIPVPNKIAWCPKLNLYILLRQTLGLKKLSK
jgi:hypothetical protein